MSIEKGTRLTYENVKGLSYCTVVKVHKDDSFTVKWDDGWTDDKYMSWYIEDFIEGRVDE